jgi:hypothetical protein
MLLWLAEIVRANGVVSSALILSLVTFCIKFVAYRPLGPTDLVAGFSELPATASATCCSLIIAGMYLPKADGRVLSVFLMITILVFLINVGVFRYVDQRKLSLSSVKGRVVAFSLASYALSYFISIFSATYAYGTVAP